MHSSALKNTASGKSIKRIGAKWAKTHRGSNGHHKKTPFLDNKLVKMGMNKLTRATFSNKFQTINKIFSISVLLF